MCPVKKQDGQKPSAKKKKKKKKKNARTMETQP